MRIRRCRLSCVHLTLREWVSGASIDEWMGNERKFLIGQNIYSMTLNGLLKTLDFYEQSTHTPQRLLAQIQIDCFTLNSTWHSDHLIPALSSITFALTNHHQQQHDTTSLWCEIDGLTKSSAQHWKCWSASSANLFVCAKKTTDHRPLTWHKLIFFECLQLIAEDFFSVSYIIGPSPLSCRRVGALFSSIIEWNWCVVWWRAWRSRLPTRHTHH